MAGEAKGCRRVNGTGRGRQAHDGPLHSCCLPLHYTCPLPPAQPLPHPPPLPLLHPSSRYKLLLAGIIDDPKERKLMTIDDDYEEPLLTVIEGNGAGSSTGEIRPEWRGARGEWGRVIVPHG